MSHIWNKPLNCWRSEETGISQRCRVALSLRLPFHRKRFRLPSFVATTSSSRTERKLGEKNGTDGRLGDNPDSKNFLLKEWKYYEHIFSTSTLLRSQLEDTNLFFKSLHLACNECYKLLFYRISIYKQKCFFFSLFLLPPLVPTTVCSFVHYATVKGKNICAIKMRTVSI